MAVWEGKKYKLVKSENFDEYLKFFGVGYLLRKVITSVSSTIFMTKTSDDEYEIHTTSTMKNMVVKFKPGVEFDETTPNGEVARSVITFVGDNKVLHTQKLDKTVTIVREFSETDLTMTMQCENVEAKRYFKVIE